MNERKQVVEKLPSVLVKQITGYITKNAAFLGESLLQTTGVNEEAGVSYTVQLAVDSTLFPIE
jgi:hypothetical protein